MADFNEVANMMENTENGVENISNAAENLPTDVHMINDGLSKKGIITIAIAMFAGGAAYVAGAVGAQKLSDKIEEKREEWKEKRAAKKAKKAAKKNSVQKKTEEEFKGEEPNKVDEE